MYQTIQKIKLISFILLLNFVPLFSCSQTISGEVVDENNQKITLAYLKIYDAGNINTISETSIIYNGIFSILLKKRYQKILLEVSASGYQPEQLLILGLKKGEIKQITFTLRQIKASLLEEVIVRAKQNPIIIRKDTTTYKLSAFKDGTERKLEEILKKLPGIDVNSKTGEIRFKGKPIETVLVEGDDLFSSNYTLGTKNINADIVDEVQAIENYSDNYVLKGLEKEEKVALNIKTKNTSLKISGNSDIGSGLFEDGHALKDLNTNLIGINSSHKFFATTSFNNTGQNKSHVDYLGNNTNVEQRNDRKYFSEKFIPESNYSFFIDEKRLNNNKQFFNNYNGLLKLSNKIRLRTNLFYTDDEIKNQQLYETEYYFATDTFYNRDITNIKRRLRHYRADIYIRNNVSGKSLLEYTATIRQENNNSGVVGFSNLIPKYDTRLLTNVYFFKQNLLFSQRVSKKAAIQISMIRSFNNADQNYTIAPSIYKRLIYNADNQSSRFKKNYLLFQSNIIGVFQNGNYNFLMKAYTEKSNYGSFVYNDSSLFRLEYFENNLRYLKSTIQQSGNIVYNFARWKFNSSYSIIYLKQQLIDRILKNNLNSNDLYVEPNLNISYKMSRLSTLNAAFSISQKPNVEQHIFYNYVIQNNRNVLSNIPSLDLEKVNQVRLYYTMNDLYNQFTFTLGTRYENSVGGYLPIYMITDSILFSQYIFRTIRNKSLINDFNISKYIPKISSTVKLSAEYSIREYKNIINTSALRGNVNQNLHIEFFYKSAFKMKINFENSTAFSTNNTNRNRKNAINSVQNSFKIIAKPSNKLFIVLLADYFLPNTKIKNNNNLFVDFDLMYRPMNTKVELRLSARNLLNNKSFSLFNVTDFSKSLFQTNILSRHVGVFFSFLF